MLHKNLKIWFGISAISIFILLIWTNQSMNIISKKLIKNDVYFQEIADEYSGKILSILYHRIAAYPEYHLYFDYAEKMDSFSKTSLTNLRITDLETDRNYIIDSLLYVDEYVTENEIEHVSHNIYGFSNKELAHKQLQNWSFNFSKATRIQRNRFVLFNFYAEKTHGSWHWWDSAEPIFINTSINTLLNEKYQFQVGMSKGWSERLRYVKIWINDEPSKVLDRKVRYKKQATKSGWNDLKIKFEGEYKNEIFTDSLTYRYFVCD